MLPTKMTPAGLLLAFIWASWCGAEQAPNQAAEPIRLNNASGHQVQLLDPSRGRVSAFVFIQPNCPISNQYAPVLNRLWDQYHDRGVDFYLVYADKDLSPETIQNHKREYRLKAEALLDPDRVLAKRTGATVTPEAVVFDRDARRVYRGRIDNRHVDFGRKRVRATQNDLRDALGAVVAGKPVEHAVTKAVGCYIHQSD